MAHSKNGCVELLTGNGDRWHSAICMSNRELIVYSLKESGGNERYAAYMLAYLVTGGDLLKAQRAADVVGKS